MVDTRIVYRDELNTLRRKFSPRINGKHLHRAINSAIKKEMKRGHSELVKLVAARAGFKSRFVRAVSGFSARGKRGSIWIASRDFIATAVGEVSRLQRGAGLIARKKALRRAQRFPKAFQIKTKGGAVVSVQRDGSKLRSVRVRARAAIERSLLAAAASIRARLPARLEREIERKIRGILAGAIRR